MPTRTTIVSLCIICLVFLSSVVMTPTSHASTHFADEDTVHSMPVKQANNNFVPLVGIPFVDTSTPTSLGQYVNALYLAAISIAAFLAVVKIIFAGVQYMLSEVVTSKEQAKKSIYGAVIGLLIVLGAFLILNTINPNLTNLTNLDGPQLQTESGNIRVEYVENEDDPCAQFITDPDTGERICQATEGDINGDTLRNEDVSGGNLVNAIPADEHREAAGAADRATLQNLIEERQAEAAETCGVSTDEIIVTHSPGFQGVRFYCPEASADNSTENTTQPITYIAPDDTAVEINPDTTYTITEPPIPEANIPAGEFHNQSGTIVGITGSDSADTDNPNTTPLEIEVTPLLFEVRLASGETTLVPCGLLEPRLPGC